MMDMDNDGKLLEKSTGTNESRTMEEMCMDLSRNSSRAKFVNGFLAVCPNCMFNSADLLKCTGCNSILAAGVEIIVNPHRSRRRPKPLVRNNEVVLQNTQPLPLSRQQSSITPAATVAQAPPSPVALSLPPPDSSNLREPAMSTSSQRFQKTQPVKITLQQHDQGVEGNSASTIVERARLKRKRETIIRIIQNTQDDDVSTAEKNILFQVRNQPNSNYNSAFYAQIDLEDSIIVESTLHHNLKSIKISQLVSSTSHIILEDQDYQAKLRKVTFSCPLSLDFVIKMLKCMLNLDSIAFEAQSFNLTQTESPWVFVPEQLKLEKVKSLEMTFDRSKYSEYSSQGKEILEQKMSIILQMALEVFPGLSTCNICIPDNMEAQLDRFLAARPDIRKRGCKMNCFKDNLIRFYVESSNSSDAEGERTDRGTPSPTVSRTTNFGKS